MLFLLRKGKDLSARPSAFISLSVFREVEVSILALVINMISMNVRLVSTIGGVHMIVVFQSSRSFFRHYA